MFNDKLKKSVACLTIAGMLTCNLAISAPVAKKPALRAKATDNNSMLLEGNLSLARGNQLISISLRESDVKQVLRLLADKGGINVVFHKSVKGNITLDLVNVTLNDAFKMIMQASELSYIIDKNTLIVSSAEASKKLDITKQSINTIKIKYVNAAHIAEFLNKNVFSINKPGLSNSEIVVTNPRTNEILVFGTKSDYLIAQKIVNKLDTPPRSTTFKVNHTTPKEMSEMICRSVFKTEPGTSLSGDSSSSSSESSSSSSENSSSSSGSDSSSSGSGSSSSGSSSSSSGSSSSSSESSSSSGSGSSSSGFNDIKLGQNVLACAVKMDVNANNLKSLSDNGILVTYSPQIGTITLIGGSSEQEQMVSNFVKENDIKQAQAYLEMSIISLNEDGSKTLENDFQIWSRWFSGSIGGSGLSTNPLHPVFWAGSGYNVVDSETMQTKYSVNKYYGPFTLVQTINLLVQNDKGRTLANPKVIITNGQKSIIDLSSDYVKSVTSQVLGGTGALAGAVQRTYNIADDAGIKVELVPFISPDGYVSLNIKPEYSTVKNQVYVTDPYDTKGSKIVGATLMQRRNLDLRNVRIKDGETLVIGGLIQEYEKKEVSKTPLLGDIPGIGFLFRNTTTVTQKEELVIMLTPRIIKDSEEVVTTNL